MSNTDRAKEIRYPAEAHSLEQLSELVDDCPPWAVRKFSVTFEGKTLDYGAAANLVNARRRQA